MLRLNANDKKTVTPAIYIGESMVEPKSEKVIALETKLKQAKARLTRLKATESKAARKIDTRRKIIVGAAVMAHAEIDPEFAKILASVLDKAITRQSDFDLIPDLTGKATLSTTAKI